MAHKWKQYLKKYLENINEKKNKRRETFFQPTYEQLKVYHVEEFRKREKNEGLLALKLRYAHSRHTSIF